MHRGRRQTCQHPCAALSGERQRCRDIRFADHRGGHNDRVGHHATSQLTHHVDRLGCRRRGVGGTEFQRRLALELDRVDRDDAGRAADARALNGCGANAARADHHRGVAAPHVGAAGCRAIPGGNRARQ
jgi:hypothetical protein